MARARSHTLRAMVTAVKAVQPQWENPWESFMPTAQHISNIPARKR
jgi:hypothetical protein